MATASSSAITYGANDAGFRLWGEGLEDTLVAAGVTLVSSTINWTTVTYPATNATSAGVSVFKFDDALSATKEVYFEINFMRGNSAGATYGFRLSVRVADNSSFTSAATVYAQMPHSGTDDRWDVCFQDGGVVAVLNGTGTNNPMLVVERSRDNTGVYTTDGVSAMLAGFNHDTTSTSQDLTFGYASVDWTRNVVSSSGAGSDVPLAQFAATPVTWSSTTAVLPVLRQFGAAFGPSLMIAGVNDLANGAEVEVTEGAGTATYRTPTFSTSLRFTAASYALYRWE